MKKQKQEWDWYLDSQVFETSHWWNSMPMELYLVSRSDVPKDGRNSIYVASGPDGFLHFTAFNDRGEKSLDKDESELPEKTDPITELKELLAKLWKKKALLPLQKQDLLNAVSSILYDRKHAAWYELLRRHPEVGLKVLSRPPEHTTDDWETETWVRTQTEGTPPLASILNILAVIGSKSWINLSESNRTAFQKALGRTQFHKGRSRRSGELAVIFNPMESGSSNCEIRHQAEMFASEILSFSFGTYGERIHHEPSGATLFGKTYRALQKGMMVMAVDLENSDPGEIREQLLSFFGQFEKCKGRNTTCGWLSTIEDYEKCELKRRRENACNPKEYTLKSTNQKQRLKFQKLFDGLEFPG